MNDPRRKFRARITGAFLGVALCLLAAAVSAQTQVTPSDRILTRLNVREHPAAADTVAVVGKLLKNETADLVDSVPRWHLIRLDNGVEGYVSKAYADTFTAASGLEEMRIRLGAWNIKKLGHGSSKDYRALAGVIEAHFDVVALVEVMQKQGGHPGYDRLLMELGDEWQGVVTEEQRPKTSSGSAEFYAVLFRPENIRLKSGWSGLRYFTDHDGGPDGSGEDVFSREPAYVYLEIFQDDGSIACDFLFGAYHATWQKGSIPAISAEAGRIDDVLTEMAASATGESDVWMVGDFNLIPELLDPLTTATNIGVGTGSTLNSTGAVTANRYEHFLVRDIATSSELVGHGRILDVREVAQSPDVFYGSVSDHLPIMVEVHAISDDD